MPARCNISPKKQHSNGFTFRKKVHFSKNTTEGTFMRIGTLETGRGFSEDGTCFPFLHTYNQSDSWRGYISHGLVCVGGFIFKKRG